MHGLSGSFVSLTLPFPLKYLETAFLTQCGKRKEFRGGSNEYPQSMYFSRNKKSNVYPCKPKIYYIKVEFKGVRII